MRNNQLSRTIRDYLLETHNYKCELCGWGKQNPITHLVPLEIHHIDGNYLNNRPENLQVLCPNCHSLTPNYKALNRTNRERTQVRKQRCIDCGKELLYGGLRCKACETKRRIITTDQLAVDRNTLKHLIRTVSFVEIGKRYGVTDNTIRKWCIKFDLPSKKKDINAYSDKEWALI